MLGNTFSAIAGIIGPLILAAFQSSLCELTLDLYIYMHSSVYLSIHPSVDPFIHLFIHPSIHPSIHSFIRPSIYFYIYSFTKLLIHLTKHSPIHPSIHIFIYPCKIFFIWLLKPLHHPSIHQSISELLGMESTVLTNPWSECVRSYLMVLLGDIYSSRWVEHSNEADGRNHGS